jgi:hemolysin III
MINTGKQRTRSLGEEIVNAITHGLGLVFVLAAVPFALATALKNGGAMAVVGTVTFLATAITLYLASTLYHAMPPGRMKRGFQIADHCAIFLLIAGTYTPFTLGVLRGPWGWSLFGVIWGLAALGIVVECVAGKRIRSLSIGLYLAMGWLAVVAIVPLATHVRIGGLALIVAGGIAYTTGVGFYVVERIRYFHAVWHGFVLLGTAIHGVAVVVYSN